jgi:prepilin-type N-terminal cleavage/methylation domain-containing protein
MLLSRPRRRADARRARGFTLPEVLVSTAILVLLGAMTVPSLVSYKNAKDARAVSSTLSAVALSLNNPNSYLGNLGFVQRVGFYPQQLSHLITPISTAMKDCTGAAYTSGEVSSWTAGAPYSTSLIIANQGIPTPLGWIRDTVYVSATTDYVELRMDSVETDDVQNLDLAVDLFSDSTLGVLRYEPEPAAPTNATLHRVRYLIPQGTGC